MEKSLSDLQKSRKFYLSEVTGKKVRRERWRGVESIQGYLFFLFEKQYITFRLTKNTVVLNKKKKNEDPVRIRFTYGREGTTSVYVYNANLLSTSPNYTVERKGKTWLDHSGNACVTQDDLRKEMETHPDVELFRFLLDPNIYWGLGTTITSEVIGRLGYDETTKVKDVDVGKIYPEIVRLLLQCYYLDGKGLNIDAEYGEFHRCLLIYGKKEYQGSEISKQRYIINKKPHTLYFCKLKNIAQT